MPCSDRTLLLMHEVCTCSMPGNGSAVRVMGRGLVESGMAALSAHSTCLPIAAKSVQHMAWLQIPPEGTIQ
jgi:hypothetical protein